MKDIGNVKGGENNVLLKDVMRNNLRGEKAACLSIEVESKRIV